MSNNTATNNSTEDESLTNKLKRSRADAGLESPEFMTLQNHVQHELIDSDDDLDSCDGSSGRPGTPGPKPGKKTRGRVKINMEFIENKLRRYTTFSKRKSGIMKKAHELATLTGTQVMLLVASETGHVYTFATRKLQPILSSEAGKQLIQTCLNSPDPPESNVGQNFDEQRMSAQGFEEPDLTYAPPEETKDGIVQKTYLSPDQDESISPSQQSHLPNTAPSTNPSENNMVLASQQVPVNLIAMSNPANANALNSLHLPASYTFVTDTTQVQQRSIDLTNSQSQSVSRPQQTPNSTFSQPAIMQYTPNLVQSANNDGRITLLSSYNTLQRGAMQPVLWSPALQVPQQTVAVVKQTSPSISEKKK